MSNELKSDWLIVAEICHEKGVDMKILVWPEKYRDDISSANRARTLKEAAKRGITIQGLSSLCPLSERRLRSIVGNGEPYKAGNVTGQNGQI